MGKIYLAYFEPRPLLTKEQIELYKEEEEKWYYPDGINNICGALRPDGKGIEVFEVEDGREEELFKFIEQFTPWYTEDVYPCKKFPKNGVKRKKDLKKK